MEVAITLGFASLFILLLATLLRKFGPRRVRKEPDLKKTMFLGIGVIGLFATILTLATGISMVANLMVAFSPTIKDPASLSSGNGAFVLSGTTLLHPRKEVLDNGYAICFDTYNSQDRRGLFLKSNGGIILVTNRDFTAGYTERKTLAYQGKTGYFPGTQVSLYGMISSYTPPAGNQPLKGESIANYDYATVLEKGPWIQAFTLVRGDRTALCWFMATRQIFPGLLAFLIALAGMGNTCYAFWLIHKQASEETKEKESV